MKILKVHTSAFMRQVHEAVAIEINEKQGLLNSKGGFNRCKLPRLSIKMGDIEKKDKEEVEKEMSEMEIEKAIEILRKERRLRSRKEDGDQRDDWIGKQEPPRKKKKRWAVEFGRKRQKPDEIENNNLRDAKSNKRRKMEFTSGINQISEIYQYQEEKEVADEGVCDNLSSQKRVTTENECLLQRISSSKPPNEKPSNVTNIVQLFEKLRKKSDFEKHSDIHIFNGKKKIEKNFPLTAGSGFRRGGIIVNSENKANQEISPKLPTTHQPKKKPRFRCTKQPNFNYKPINHHFKTKLAENESKSAGKELSLKL